MYISNGNRDMLDPRREMVSLDNINCGLAIFIDLGRCGDLDTHLFEDRASVLDHLGCHKEGTDLGVCGVS